MGSGSNRFQLQRSFKDYLSRVNRSVLINNKSSLKPIRIALRRGIIRFQNKFGPLTEALAVLFLGFIFILILWLTGMGDLGNSRDIFISYIFASVTVYLIRRAARHQEILIEITTSYLMHGGKLFLDELLGKLISGSWKNEQLKPGDALFGVLEDVSSGEDWELKRRITEALPALSEIDLKRTMKILSILRDDWNIIWETDLRRRVIESLTIPLTSGAVPFIHRLKLNQIKALLSLREKDQVYTVFAVVEALDALEKSESDMVVKLSADLKGFVQYAFTQEEREAIDTLKDLLTLLGTNNLKSVVAKFEEMSLSVNKYVQIAAARNLMRISDTLPEQTLIMMEILSNPDQHRNVRRPISKEQSVEFLIKMISNSLYVEKAKGLLLKLTKDEDEIIRVTVFDKAEMLVLKDRMLLIEMCDTILQNDKETSESLKSRASRIKDDIANDHN